MSLRAMPALIQFVGHVESFVLKENQRTEKEIYEKKI